MSLFHILIIILSISWCNCQGKLCETFSNPNRELTTQCFDGNFEDVILETLEKSAIDSKILKLDNCLLPSIQGSFLIHMKSLTDLTILHSGVMEIQNDSFTGLENLLRLNLSFNDLTAIPAASFLDMFELKTLNLSSNIIETLEENSLEGLLNLQTLDLSNNSLGAIPPGIFMHSPVIMHVRLADNDLKQIPVGLFLNMLGLTSVDLSANQIANLAPRTFQNTPKLARLNLSKNRLLSFRGDIFVKPQLKLAYVNLESNQLTWLDMEFVAAMPNLKEARIFNNPWTCSCVALFIAYLKQRKLDFATKNFSDARRPYCVIPTAFDPMCRKLTDAEIKSITSTYRNAMAKYKKTQ